MLLHSAGLRLDPRYDPHGSSFRPKLVGAFNNFPSRNSKRFPAIIVMGHRHSPCGCRDDGGEIVGCVRQGIRESRWVVVPSPVFCEESMQDIAAELQQVVFKAAGTIKPGMGIKAQINAACDALGYPRGHWRVRDAWYGTASNWNGKAIFDLLGRYNRLCQKAGSDVEPVNEPVAVIAKASNRG
ncbi:MULTISPECIES: hypothetical protein [unclassified Mesorhizobium]|uniref:hypothetical protein n=1 Tax=unclassified Mesorhizobium TaxID=325217 RepID=UPI000F74D2FB|nr:MULTISPECIES: hypothetical protein [unclassified Mesorhizobium]AZO61731.1 hypothetical protein EJ078_22550 [Mesorhizobium sp. M1A.F.Ca.IN.022.06.1.1]MCT2580529.1 hypothetical protein [Mesorhizobium sp. P13.3]MDF3169471.1 hypothetical protein [Mesorhizobium sp. P16.1]MDF3178867.1 hypothetical protein [Mesorhizobium sp. P17.1]MDF3186386.1 hypothetical protein [Mesorhizobium sp. ICCV3110.1]